MFTMLCLLCSNLIFQLCNIKWMGFISLTYYKYEGRSFFESLILRGRADLMNRKLVLYGRFGNFVNTSTFQ